MQNRTNVAVGWGLWYIPSSNFPDNFESEMEVSFDMKVITVIKTNVKQEGGV